MHYILSDIQDMIHFVLGISGFLVLLVTFAIGQSMIKSVHERAEQIWADLKTDRGITTADRS